MTLERFQGVPVGQSALFHQDRDDNPTPTGELSPLPVKKAARKELAVIPAGQTESNPVDISGADHIALVLPDGFDGTIVMFRVSDAVDGTYHDLYVNNYFVRVYIGADCNPYGVAVSMNLELEPAFRPWQFVKLVAVEVQTAERTFEIHQK